jgi:hypothetical protein
MSGGQSPRRRKDLSQEPRAPLFEVQEKPLREPPRPLQRARDPFDDLPAVGTRARPTPLLKQPEIGASEKPASAPHDQPAEQHQAQPRRKAAPEARATQPRRPALEAPAAGRQPVYVPLPHWEPATFTQGRPLLLLLVALLCGAIIWMASASPKTIISSFRTPGFITGASGSGGQTIPSLDTPDGEHTLIGEPTISAAAIDTILAQYGSPAQGTGQLWFDLGKQYGMDPAYALAFFIHESSAGTNPGWAGLKQNGASTHNIGNIICAGYPTCYGRFRDYGSWEEGIDDWYKLISKEYINGRGAHTVEAIIPIYAPSSDNNNVPGYVGAVIDMVSSWRQGVLR